MRSHARWSSAWRKRAERAARLPRRPRVYFEEWDEPMISGIGWVSELVEAAGGIDVFKHLSGSKSAKDRIVTADAVDRGQARHRDRLLVRQEIRAGEVRRAPGLRRDPGGARRFLREIKSALILQPGPAALTDGLDALENIIAEWAKK